MRTPVTTGSKAPPALDMTLTSPLAAYGNIGTAPGSRERTPAPVPATSGPVTFATRQELISSQSQRRSTAGKLPWMGVASDHLGSGLNPMLRQ